MSWSKSIKGAAAIVVAAVANWPGEVGAQDREWQKRGDGTTTDATILGHNGQVNAAAAAAREAAAVAPEGSEISVSAGGHASSDGSGSCSVSISVTVPKAKAEAVDSDATGASEPSEATVESTNATAPATEPEGAAVAST